MNDNLSRMLAAQADARVREKSEVVAIVLCIFLGYLGIHRFYTQNYIIGILQLLTFGGFGLWWIIDIFLIAGRVRYLNMTELGNTYRRYGLAPTGMV